MEVRDALVPTPAHVELIHTNLSNDQEAGLREAFAEEDVVSSR
jgi:uncharacterized membrane protein